MAKNGAVLNVRKSACGCLWQWRDEKLAPSFSDRHLEKYAQDTGLDETVCGLLYARGVKAADANRFLGAKIRDFMVNPQKLHNINRAVARLREAILKGEKIGVFGDYDVDGACSTALLVQAMRGYGLEAEYHIPDRLKEGYGPSAKGIEKLMSDGCTLLLFADCGSSAGRIMERYVPGGPMDAKNGVEMIIFDHHIVQQDAMPRSEWITLINPHNPESPGDFPKSDRSICAAAVVWMALVDLSRELRGRGWAESKLPDLWAALDLVALATIADVMPLTHMNRALVKAGLRQLADRLRPGLSVLAGTAGIKRLDDSRSLGFSLAPRINAAGRIGDSTLGTRLLLCGKDYEAEPLSQELEGLNARRREMEARLMTECAPEAQKQLDAGHAAILITGRNYHPGIVGIVASRLKERFNRPALVGGWLAEDQPDGDGTPDNPLIKGSGRSVEGLDLGAMVGEARRLGLIVSGGGHAAAAGFGAYQSQIGAFHAFLDENCQKAHELPEAPALEIDGIIPVSGARLELARLLESIGPFGQANPEPVLALKDVRVTSLQRIGKTKNTLRVQLGDTLSRKRLKAVLFNADSSPAARLLEDSNRPLLHVAGHLRAESWRGKESESFFITDAARAQE